MTYFENQMEQTTVSSLFDAYVQEINLYRIHGSCKKIGYSRLLLFQIAVKRGTLTLVKFA